MKTVNKVMKRKDGSEVEYTVTLPETLAEADHLLGVEGVLQAVCYSVTVKAAKKATIEPPLPKEIQQLLRKDPELRALVAAKLRETKATEPGTS